MTHSPSFRWTSQRVQTMPSSIFHIIDQAKAKARQNHAIIDLSIGSSDLAPPRVAIDALADAVQDKSTYGYCLHAGTQPLRQAIVDWYAERFPAAPALDSDALVTALAAEGWQIPSPKATMFAWAKLPDNVIRYYERQKEATGLAPCVAFCLELIDETGVCTSPGSAFGTQGYGYLRFALVQPPEVLRVAAQAIGAKFRSLAEKGA